MRVRIYARHTRAADTTRPLVCKGAEALAIAGLLLGVDVEPLPARSAHARTRSGRLGYRTALVTTGLLAAVVASYAGSALMPGAAHDEPHEHTQPHEHAAVHPTRGNEDPFNSGARVILDQP